MHGLTEQETPGEFVYPLNDGDYLRWLGLPAAQQPSWPQPRLARRARADLARLPGLVDAEEVTTLRELLAEVASGELQVLQAGDCAEDLAACERELLGRKVGLLDSLAGLMRAGSGKPVIRVGRIAGQFAKPRSALMEERNGVQLPAFRGLLVNRPEFDAESRRPDPSRMLECYRTAASTLTFLRSRDAGPSMPGEPIVWTSHEALVLDYELSLVRRDRRDRALLTSTHWPWIGERTRQLDGAHVNLLAGVVNPVACKVGPSMTPDELVALCACLDPQREPGRLSLIARLGAATVSDALPRLVAAVQAAGHPVIWLCDPMHANTVTCADGRKTRVLSSILHEVREFQRVVAAASAVAGGLHLETTPLPVDECVADASELPGTGRAYTTLCDPRLNPQQALAVAAAWTAAADPVHVYDA